MKRYLLFLMMAAAGTGLSAQTKKKPATRTPTAQERNHPNVSGQPDVITAPVLDNATSQPQPDIKMNIKRQRKVRVVPAPPPPGPIAPVTPPR